MSLEAKGPSGGSLPIVSESTSGDIQEYDPHGVVDRLDFLKVAEEHFARAKDVTRLYEAIEAKLGEQRRFVVWWDEQEKQHGKLGDRPVTQFVRLEDLGLDKKPVSRWRKKLKDPKKYDAALDAASERCRRICESEKGSTEQKGASGTGQNEWYTPAIHLNAAREVLGEIDLDPASSDTAQRVVGASKYFTTEDDGLSQEWHGRVWLNPPYAQPHIADFVSKLVAERRIGRVTSAILLTHNYTDTAWFHEAASAADAICFTRGRVKFESPDGSVAAPTQGQAFFYFGSDVQSFMERFSGLGFVVRPCRPA